MVTLKIDELKPGMIVAEPVVTKRGQVISKVGSELSSQLIARLSFYKIDQVTVEDPIEEEDDDFEVVLQEEAPPAEKAYVSDQISYSQRLKASPKFQQFQIDYTVNIGYLKENIDAIIAGAGSECSDLLIENCEPLFKSKTSLELFDMLHNMRGMEDSIYAHSLNVALISRAIGKWSKFGKDTLDMLTVAGLLHDIGKTQIPDEILNKPGKYTDEERETVQSHPLLGYKLLQGKDFHPSICHAVLQHHERMDGTGYPRKLYAEEIDDVAAIVAIADVYDAMTAARSYRDPLCAFQVIAEFEKDGLSKYNTKYILTFLEHIAATYQNSRVLLTDAKAGRVVYINKRNLSRPVIELDSGEIIDLSSPIYSGLSIQAII